MSRHRNIRNKNYDDEYAGYDDVYGHSVEDDSYCVSPATAEQFLFQRSHHEHNLSSFMREESINEEEEESDDETPLNDSRNYQRPILNPIDEAKLQSCLEEIRNIVGETVPEHIIIDSVLHFNFNYERALDAILNQNEPPRKSSKNASKSEKQESTFPDYKHSMSRPLDSQRKETIPDSIPSAKTGHAHLAGAVGGSIVNPPPGLSCVSAPQNIQIGRQQFLHLNPQTPPNTPTNRVSSVPFHDQGFSHQHLSDKLSGLQEVELSQFSIAEQSKPSCLDQGGFLSLQNLPSLSELVTKESADKRSTIVPETDKSVFHTHTDSPPLLPGVGNISLTDLAKEDFSKHIPLGPVESESNDANIVQPLSSLSLQDLAQKHMADCGIEQLHGTSNASSKESVTFPQPLGLLSEGLIARGDGKSKPSGVKECTGVGVTTLSSLASSHLSLGDDLSCPYIAAYVECNTKLMTVSSTATSQAVDIDFSKGNSNTCTGADSGLGSLSTSSLFSSGLPLTCVSSDSTSSLLSSATTGSSSSGSVVGLTEGLSLSNFMSTVADSESNPVVGLGEAAPLSSLMQVKTPSPVFGKSASGSGTSITALSGVVNLSEGLSLAGLTGKAMDSETKPLVGLGETGPLSSLLHVKTPSPILGKLNSKDPQNLESKHCVSASKKLDFKDQNLDKETGKMTKKRGARRRGKTERSKVLSEDLKEDVQEIENSGVSVDRLSPVQIDESVGEAKSSLDSALFGEATMFAKVLCCRMGSKELPETLKIVCKIPSVSSEVGENHRDQEKHLFHHQFAYKRQKSVSRQDCNHATIIPFDFSTPSPDDIVKDKQKGAFSRTGERITSRNEATAVVDTSTEEQTIQGVARLSFPPTRESDTGAIKKTSRDELDKNGLPSFAEPTGEVVVGATSFADSPSTSASTTPSMPRVASKAKLPTIDVMAEYEKRQGTGKDLINLVVIGHVDAGKSTLMGHLLFLLGNVNKRTMHKYEQESKKAGKASFAYAWVLDETGEERERGITMDVGLTNFETTKKIVTLLDAPGHKDFIPNMITGAAQADVAILVVDASRGEFEAGFDSGGQTREHAMLVRSLGVTQLVVAVNKLDNVDWSQERYSEIVAKLGHFLKQAGFKDSEVAYIPCSGLTGENLVEHPKEARLKMWYNKHTLVEQIDKFKPPKRPIDKPFRLCVSDVFKGMGSGFSVSGKIVSGNIQAGDRILVKPAGEQGNIKTVLVQDEDTKWACAGDHVTLTVTGIDQMRVNVGSMLCSPSEPIKATTKVNARVIIFNIDVPITRGYPVVFHYQTLSEPATIKKLISLLNKSTGEVIKKKPRCLVKQSNATICIETARPVCVELYKDYKDLGRFMLRSGGSTIAAGVITEIL
ncbi:uncharacterized protein [Ptychodera flava]|uniref:uncharacterized protein isoform X2 n=1 Tax=Ptychodera flava TaxID=63121 RepID=UPI00396A6DBA